MNTDTDFDKAPMCDLGDVISRVIPQMRACREQVGAEVPIYFSKMDVKDASGGVHNGRDNKAPVFS